MLKLENSLTFTKINSKPFFTSKERVNAIGIRLLDYYHGEKS